MAAPKAVPPAVGFITVRSLETGGAIGGYLVLNQRGRPLEFHCTAPVAANRAQEILYGPTLLSYLYGEQIGQTLISAASARAKVVFTDLPEMLAVCEFIEQEVALVVAESSEADDVAEDAVDRRLRIDATHGQPRLASFIYGGQTLAIDTQQASQEQVQSLLQSIGVGFDLAEPFARIRDALDEAQLSTR